MQDDRDQGSGTRDQKPISLTEKLLIVSGTAAAFVLCFAALVRTADLHRPVHPPNDTTPTDRAMTPDAGALGRVEPTEKRPAIAGTGDAAAPADAAGVRDDRTPAAGAKASPDLRPLLDAIRRVESGGHGDQAVGDGGTSLGPYQISLAYWTDGGGAAADWPTRAFDRDASERVVLAWWGRYAPDALAAGDMETLARTHNGGPAGHRLRATLPYWHKVQAAMAASNGRTKAHGTE